MSTACMRLVAVSFAAVVAGAPALAAPASRSWSQRAQAVWSELEARRKASTGAANREQLDELLAAAEACGDWKTAAETASSLAVAEDLADYWARAAAARLALGDRRTAATACLKAIRLNPNDAVALAVRAALAIRLLPFDLSQAKAHAMAAVSADPCCGEALGVLALVALMEGRPATALAALQRGASNANLSASALYYGSGCALAAGRRELARRWAERLLERWPAHPYARVARMGLVPVSFRRVPVRLIYPALSHDGRRVVFWPGRNMLQVADVARLLKPVAETKVSIPYGPTAWTSDGAVLICQRSSRAIRLWRWDLKGPLRPLATKVATKRQRLYLLGLTFDGAAFLEYDAGRPRRRTLKLIDPAGEEKELGPVPRAVIWPSQALLSLEADAALAAVRYRSLLLWRLTTGQLTTVWPDTGAYIRPLAWIGGDAACAAVVSPVDYTEGLLAVIPFDGLPPQPAPLLPVRSAYTAMSADGKTVIYYAGQWSAVCRFASPWDARP